MYWKRIKAIIVIALLLGLMYFSYTQYMGLASRLYDAEKEREGKGYVSDEVWYVSSARNILEKIHHIKPKISSDKYGASIVYGGRINKTIVSNIIRAKNLDVNIVDTKYYKINVIYVESNNSRDIEILINELNKTGNVYDVVWGWRLADAEGINNYLNLEHPPLGKYMIMASMMLIGDNPISWRIPVIIAGVLTVFFTFLASLKLIGNEWVSLVIALLTASDPITRALSSISLLDIYVALFTSITLYFLFSRRYYTALLMVFIGSLFKFNTLFLLIPVLVLIIRNGLKKEASLGRIIYVSSLSILLSISLFLAIQMIASIPLIMHVGLTSWLNQSIFGALRWHTSIKCTGASCPVSSSPWDWFMGNNGFPLYYFTWEDKIVALGFWPFWIISLFYSIVFSPMYRVDHRYAYSILALDGMLAGYILLWLVGGKTQYSFYSVQFAPIIYLVLVYCLAYIVFRRERLSHVMYQWYMLYTYLWRKLLWILVLNRDVGKDLNMINIEKTSNPL